MWWMLFVVDLLFFLTYLQLGRIPLYGSTTSQQTIKLIETPIQRYATMVIATHVPFCVRLLKEEEEEQKQQKKSQTGGEFEQRMNEK